MLTSLLQDPQWQEAIRWLKHQDTADNFCIFSELLALGAETTAFGLKVTPYSLQCIVVTARN
jgi:hypothetical protein